ncbi:MAG: FecR domain-containing protein [Chryseolinea sp.]
MNKQKLINLVNSVFLGNANEVESALLLERTRIDHSLREDVEDIEFLLNNIQPKPYMDEFDNSYYFGLRQIEYQFIARQLSRKGIKRFYDFLLVTGSVCLIVVCIVALITKPYVADVNHGKSQFSVESRRLPDNSVIALSRDASFSFTHYPIGRRLTITGDARVQISVDSLRPLRLTTDLGSIRTLGGEMFVQVIPGDFVRIYVLSGAIEIEDQKDNRILHAGENLIFVPTGKAIRATLADEDFDFWYTGKMAFDGKRLDNVIDRLENSYNVIIRAESLPVSEYKFTGVLQKVESIDLILESICSELGLEYHEQDNGIYVLTRSSKV